MQCFLFLALLFSQIAESPTFFGREDRAPVKAKVEKVPGNADKILGIWEIVKSSDATGSGTMEFTKDGQLKMATSGEGKLAPTTGTYKVTDNKIIVMVKSDGKDHESTVDIVKLTDKELHVRFEIGKGMKIDQHFKRTQSHQTVALPDGWLNLELTKEQSSKISEIRAAYKKKIEAIEGQSKQFNSADAARDHLQKIALEIG